MAVIRVTRKHRLSRRDLRAEIGSLANEIQEKLHARCEWDGDTAHFSRTGASGSIKFDDEHIAVEITLGLALSPLKSRVERTINDRLDQLLA
jgi:putative polyhydroxyalkanoate system protein